MALGELEWIGVSNTAVLYYHLSQRVCCLFFFFFFSIFYFLFFFILINVCLRDRSAVTDLRAKTDFYIQIQITCLKYVCM